MNKKEFVGAFISENAPFIFRRERSRRLLFSYGGDIAREREGGSSAFAFRLGYFRYTHHTVKQDSDV